MDIASLAVGVLGLIVSLCGFTIAVWQIRRTRTAAESAEEAAVKAREAVLRGISIPDLVEVHAIIGELIQLHRNQDLSDIFPKYEQLRAILTDVKANLSGDYTDVLDEAIDVLMDIEDEAELPEVDATTFNGSLREIQQILHEVRAGIERYTSTSLGKGD